MVHREETPVHCSAWCRSAGLDPIGTVGTYTGYAIVDWPLPWPRDVTDIEALAGLNAAGRAAGLRVQMRVPSEAAPPRVSLYRADPGGGFVRCSADHAEIPLGSGPAAEAALGQLLESPVTGPGADAGEILLCTHGRRDRCCGSLGTNLFTEVETVDFGRPLRRTSHTGGHRFAPTAVLLPEATAWAYLDADLLRRVVARQGDVADVVAHYRGCAGLPSAAAQAVERTVLAEVGWSLFDCARWGEESGGAVRLEVTDPGGRTTVWEAQVEEGRKLTVPDCGGTESAATKVETERVVVGLRRAAAA